MPGASRSSRSTGSRPMRGCAGNLSQDDCVRAQRAFEAHLYDEVVPLIRRDCQSDTLEIITAGAGLGAFNAVAALCRHPDVFLEQPRDERRVRHCPARTGAGEQRTRIGFAAALRASSAGQLRARHSASTVRADRERRRDYEQPEESRRLAQAFSARGIPNHLDLWGPAYPHSWSTWRAMVQKYVPAML